MLGTTRRDEAPQSSAWALAGRRESLLGSGGRLAHRVGTRQRSAGRLVRPSTASVLALAWLAAFNLRSGFIGLGPVLPAIDCRSWSVVRAGQLSGCGADADDGTDGRARWHAGRSLGTGAGDRRRAGARRRRRRVARDRAGVRAPAGADLPLRCWYRRIAAVAAAAHALAVSAARGCDDGDLRLGLDQRLDRRRVAHRTDPGSDR